MKPHSDTSCELLNGQDCEVLAELNQLKKELQITRDYIHDRGLEWDLLSYSEKKEVDEWML